MRVLKAIFDFYINSSIHVALSVYALSWVTLFQFNIPYDSHMLNFIFFASISGYNFVKYFGLAKFHHRSLAKWLKTIQVFSGICFIVMCYYGIKLEIETLLCFSIFGLVTFLYAIPIIPKKIFLDQQKNLRSIGGLKIYIIAIVWAGVTVFLPLVNNQIVIANEIIIAAIQRFLIILVLMLPFEIRDLSYDSLKLATIPQKIGVKPTKILGILLTFIFLLLEFLKDEISMNSLLVNGIVAMITIVFLLFSKKKQNKYYSAFWVESLPIFWLILIWVIG